MTPVGRPRRALDVYLQPTVVGGGRGDVEEVLLVGRRLHRDGWLPRVYRKAGRPLPPGVEPFADPGPFRRTPRIDPVAARALTVSSWWGVTAAPGAERPGAPGPWSQETEDIERAYGADHVVHLSLEEFARTLTSRAQDRERFREGGLPNAEIERRLHSPGTAAEIRLIHDEYRRWRAFDRPNVLHLFPGFRPSRGFQREFPEAVQTGPLWPDSPSARAARPSDLDWLWYASPSSSDRFAQALGEALRGDDGGRASLRVTVRSPRTFPLPRVPGVEWRWQPRSSPALWQRQFRSAGLRVVTGSRTLLEAIDLGRPFLYFNGVIGTGPALRAHRPEKILSLLGVWRRRGVSPTLCRQQADAARLRGLRRTVRVARTDPAWGRQFPTRDRSVDYPPERRDAGTLIDRWAGEWALASEPASVMIRRWRELPSGVRSRL